MFIALVSLAAAIVFPIIGAVRDHYRKPKAKTQSREAGAVSVFLAGDVMLGRNVAAALSHPQSNLRTWEPYIRSADVAFANLECALTTGVVPRRGNRLLASVSALDSLKGAGFDVLSTANNHALDAGETGVRLLQQRWADKSHWVVGTQVGNGEWLPVRIPVNGRTVTWLAASTWGPFRSGRASVRQANATALTRQVKALADGGDDVIVSVHWGREYEKQPTAEQRALGRQLIEAGAKAVIGHHPHVRQETEFYWGRPIIYSLGNFLFDRTPKAQSGEAVLLRLEGDNVLVRSLAVQPDVMVKEPVPSRERLRKSLHGRFLNSDGLSQKVTWTQVRTGGHRLRLNASSAGKWTQAAQGRHASIEEMRAGDVDGDGADEVWLQLRQRSKLDVNVKARLHIYRAEKGQRFGAVWRGSGLSRPFLQWGLIYRPGKWQSDLVAIEQDPRPEFREFQYISLYRWNGFGFRRVWDHPVQGQVRLLAESVPQTRLPFEVRRGKSRQELTLQPKPGVDGLDVVVR